MADILERVLDTGVVIAGDIRVQLADIELLTIQIRLVICSVDRAEQMGMDWWKRADFLTAIEHRNQIEGPPPRPSSRIRAQGRPRPSTSSTPGSSASRRAAPVIAQAQAASIEGSRTVLGICHDKALRLVFDFRISSGKIEKVSSISLAERALFCKDDRECRQPGPADPS